MQRTSFNPSKHAFRFSNRFVNEVLTLHIGFGFWGKRIDFETSGRCGGMAFAALDYYHADRPVPDFEASDFPESDVPPDGHPLADYIYSRQLDSMGAGKKFTPFGLWKDSRRFVKWTRDSTRTLLERTVNTEIPKIKKAIDNDTPVVLGLVKATRLLDIGDNHQVVCYAYDDHSSGHTDLYIYDPNHPPGSAHYPSGEVMLSRRIRPEVDIPGLGEDVPGDSAEPIKSITRGGHPFKTEKAGTWRGFFMQRYSPKPDPPGFTRSPKPNPRPAPKPPPRPKPGKGGRDKNMPGTGKPPTHLK